MIFLRRVLFFAALAGSCYAQIPGSLTGSGFGVDGTAHQFPIYKSATDSLHRMIDATTDMFQIGYDVPGDKGLIIVYDGKNQYTLHPDNIAVMGSIGTVFSDSAAVDAHVNLGRAYQFFRYAFAYRGTDGNAASLRGVVHYGDNVPIERWSPLQNYFLFGDGDATRKPSGSAYDIVVRTAAEAFISTGSFLKQNTPDQAGSVLESLKDMIAVCADSVNWTIGESIAKTAPGFLRSVQDPHQGLRFEPGLSFAQPKTMNEFVFSLTDRGGTKVNAGIANYAGYLIASNVGRSRFLELLQRTLPEIRANTTLFDYWHALRAAAFKTGFPLTAVDTAFVQAGMIRGERIRSRLLSIDIDDPLSGQPVVAEKAAVRFVFEESGWSARRIGAFVQAISAKDVPYAIHADESGYPGAVIHQGHFRSEVGAPHWVWVDLAADAVPLPKSFYLVLTPPSDVWVFQDNVQSGDSSLIYKDSAWATAEGGWYIRLNASQTESTVSASNPKKKSRNEIAWVYPNPATTAASLRLDLETEREVKIEVVDAIGRVVYSITKDGLYPGVHTIPLELSRLSPGRYAVRILLPSGVVERGFVKPW